MAPLIDSDLIIIIIFLLGIITATLILVYSALSPEVEEDDSEES
ncbi:MAG: hypothetical protein ACW967_02655 [Candidatus Hodarchaeales archaeon]|jgi:hypothetical protein